MVALYRLVELSSGSITIDGINTSKLGLADVRGRISIIPQDPVSNFHSVYPVCSALMLCKFLVAIVQVISEVSFSHH